MGGSTFVGISVGAAGNQPTTWAHGAQILHRTVEQIVEIPVPVVQEQAGKLLGSCARTVVGPTVTSVKCVGGGPMPGATEVVQKTQYVRFRMF